MKRIVILIIALSFTSFMFGQGKLINSSTDKVPVWVKKDVEKYDIIKISETSSISLNDAKNKAFELLKTKVIISTTRYMLKNSINGDETSIRNNVTNSQFVRNIAESSSIDTYWEERFIKKDKKTIYNYYILYDFNDFELKKIALEINQGESNTRKMIDEL